MDCFHDVYPNFAVVCISDLVGLLFINLLWFLRCTCSNYCSIQLTTKPEECQYCNEIDHCREVMYRFGDSEQCITVHPGFQDVCLIRHVLEGATLGLETKSGKSYRMLFAQGRRSEAE